MSDAFALDHVVVAAATLASGVAWCEQTLGVLPENGGRHPLMGTHNRVFSIANACWPRAYFEIIAIDPDAPAPTRPRWFGLDEPALQRRLERGPCLIQWVARCADVAAVAFELQAAGADPGEPIAAERAAAGGLLRWKITVPADGLRRFGGALPTLIEWDGVHPAEGLAPSGVTLESLAAGGLPRPLAAFLAAKLAELRLDPSARVPLSLELATPRGRVTLQASPEET